MGLTLPSAHGHFLPKWGVKDKMGGVPKAMPDRGWKAVWGEFGCTYRSIQDWKENR